MSAELHLQNLNPEDLRLQAGGTLNPRQHVYVERTEDSIFQRLLLEGEYVNVLTARQMGKSSLMMRTVHQFEAKGVRWVTIDLASELGSPPDLNTYYIGLLSKVVRNLRLDLDLKAWWAGRDTDTVNQRLLAFFREVVGGQIAAPVVIFLDEIDSTLRLPYTDDLFTAIRGMYNERSLVEGYRRIAFCLLGVATPNELIKDRRTTPYNVGTTLELRDFDKDLDDLSPLANALAPDRAQGARLLDRVLHWTGGQPYLTQRFCTEIVEKEIGGVQGIDELVTKTFDRLDHASSDIHFQQILRFLEQRADESAIIKLYARILKDGHVPDLTTPAHAELKLSSLAKRDRSGNLVVRNLIYRRLFDSAWVAGTRPQRALAVTRRYALAASFAFLVVLGGGATYYAAVVRPEQRRLAALDRLAQLGVTITQSEAPAATAGTRAALPLTTTQPLLAEAIRLLKSIGSVTEIGFNNTRPSTENGFPKIAIDDLSPFADLSDLRILDLEGPSTLIELPEVRSLEALKGLTNLISLTLEGASRITTLEPLKGLKSLISLTLTGASGITSLEPLKELTGLTSLTLTGVSDITSLEPLRGLKSLTSLRMTEVSGITSLEPLEGLKSLTSLDIRDVSGVTPITSLEPLKGLTSLETLTLRLGATAASLEPLEGLTNLRRLTLFSPSRFASLDALQNLTNLTYLFLGASLDISSLEPFKELSHLATLVIFDAKNIMSLEPLKGLANLERLSLNQASGIMSLEPLKNLTRLTSLELSGTTGITSLEPLRGLTRLTSLDLTETSGNTSLEPLKGLTRLASLDVTRATGITSLAPLKGRKIEIRGASPELLATMN